MDYIDVKKLYTQNIVLYCRVSTAEQDILKQITLAEIYLSQNDITTDTVKRFIDDNVSANKLAAKDRPEFQKLLTEIMSGTVDTLLVQSRDRLARNFYEYVELVKKLHQFKVKVVFTDPGQPLFSQVLAIESLYGIFPQFDGRTIARRTQQTRLRYPNAILGFDVIGKRNEKRYIPHQEKANELKSFFYSVIDSQSPENLIELFIKHRKFFKNPEKALKCLQNPFYSGHLQYQDEYIPLLYVEPLISLEEYLKIQRVLAKYEQELQNAIASSTNNGINTPICHICKKPMHFRPTELGKSGYYVCSKKHPKIQIEVRLFNQLITNHLTDVLERIQVKELKKDVCNYLFQLEKHYKQELAFLQNQLNTTHREVTDLIGSNKTTTLKQLIEQGKSIEKAMIKLDMLLEKIGQAQSGIDRFVSIVKQRVTDELQNYQIEYVFALLFSKVEVSTDALIYHTTFSNYIEGNDFSNEDSA
ncbi:recombinase family protein [Bacillus massiliigorillae]|uniref:recombinase family protein n=1 Tax=Bacillus massiliigorillae TaxID=1243664 RepID=UPI0003A68726|nr:recombinase family protein [Bacillus massiliigorillae]